MEQTYGYAWMLPFIPLPVPMLIGARLIIFKGNKKVSLYVGFSEHLRFLAYMSFLSTSKLELVTNSNSIQIYILCEFVGVCSYLLIRFWFTRLVAANACQKAFKTNLGDFGLLVGILGFY
uniref:NADH:quinone oxidoreductase/Mrp antiporter transmembrane domain-containing protein n=1 Tax=Solanum lycopersicum TaxID=4081 RepID=K4B4H1_SOLLC